MPFNLQPTHLLLIAVAALLIFGPSRLPEMGRAMGKTIKEFQAGTKEAMQDFQTQVQSTEVKSEEPAKQTCKACSKSISVGKFCPECGASQ